MSEAEKKLIPVTVIVVCVTIVVTFLFISLWQYREILAIILVVLLIAIVGVYLWRMINEQRLRHVRYHHGKETPLSASQYPPYAQGTQTTGPYSMPVQPNQYYYPSSAYYDQRQQVKD
jgi:flagellar basal body-associated protein FliL